MNVYQIAKQLMQEQTSITEAFNGAYKELPPHIKQALAQSKFAKNLSDHGIDQNSKPVFTKVNSESELNKQLRQLQKVHGDFAGFAIEILSPEENPFFVKNSKAHQIKSFEPGSENPIFIFALRNGYEQATLATKGNINKYSEHATNLTASQKLAAYTTTSKVERSTFWLEAPYDKIEALLSRSKGANLYAFVGSGQSIARQRADNMDFVDKYEPTKSPYWSGQGPTPFMASARDGELRRKYRADKKERELQQMAALGDEVVIKPISTLSDLKAVYEASRNKKAKSIKVGNVWLRPYSGSFERAVDFDGVYLGELLQGKEVRVGSLQCTLESIDVSMKTFDYEMLRIYAKLNGDKIVLRTELK